MTKEELIQELNESAEEIEELEGSYGYIFGDIADMVKDSDLVEVIRCKDCKYFHDYGDGVKNCWGDGGGTKDNDFCSQAERKDG